MLKQCSIIDTRWPGDLADVVATVDQLGYARYWTTEHHSPVQSSSPVLTAALAAGLSDRLRVGTAGVLLKLAAPFKIAEDFRLLELFFPGRIDLGIAGAMPDGDVGERLLDGRPYPTRESYEAKVSELVSLVRNVEQTADAPGPLVQSVPQIWLCGMSVSSGELAGRLGIGFSFHHTLAKMAGCVDDLGPSAIRAYRGAFEPVTSQPEPSCNVATYGLAAEGRAEAESLWCDSGRGDEAGFIGDSGDCAEQLHSLCHSYDVPEAVIQSPLDDVATRLRSYELLAEALKL